MILEALVSHYDRLAEDPDSGIAPYGFSRQKVSFCVVVNPDGTLHAIEPLIDESSGKPRPVELVVPGQAKPPGSGINPGLLWDNPAYALGFVPEGTEAKKAQRAIKCFEAFRERHVALQKELADDGLSAVCQFLKGWDPATLPEGLDTQPLSGTGFGVLRIRGASSFLHESKAVQSYWRSQLNAETSDDNATASEAGQCLVTGERGPLARLHEPKIKGVSGAQSAGATLVSFNDKAYESYGKEQGVNAPVSESAAFKYATALNQLLANRAHRIQLGDTTCVFWTERTPASGPDPADALADTLGFWTDPKASPETEEVEVGGALREFLGRYRQGRSAPNAGDLKDASTRFYVLGLAPNAARISIRFWLPCTVVQLAECLDNHVNAVELTGGRDGRATSTVRDLLRETGREAKDIPPVLAGELARAVLTGGNYPRLMAVSIMRRIVADRTINHPRVSALKAWLIRNHEMEISVALDPDRTDPAYLLGRLFAAYEKVQQDASGGNLNRTIRDSYLSAASATPGSVFPRIYRLNQHHFNKLRREKRGLAVVREKLIGEICAGLDDFPKHLGLADQGLFAIGYYHQNQDFYTPRAEVIEADATTGA